MPWSGKRGSNPRPSAWKADALPSELFPHCKYTKISSPKKSRPISPRQPFNDPIIIDWLCRSIALFHSPPCVGERFSSSIPLTSIKVILVERGGCARSLRSLRLPTVAEPNSPPCVGERFSSSIPLTSIKVILVERGGFEPPKASPTDLQSVPFGRSGTSPDRTHHFLIEQIPPGKDKDWKINELHKWNKDRPEFEPIIINKI
jgi:hypothetical protein